MTVLSERPGALRLRRRALLSAALVSPFSWALGRRPYGGVLRLELPFAVDALDPHAGGDATSAFLATAIADPLFAWDASGSAYPALAARMPEPVTGGARVTLRPGLVTAGGRLVDARDVVASLERSRRGAGRPLLAPFGAPRRDASDPLGIVFPNADPDALADALASPVTAIVSRASLAERVDGTGAFRATGTSAGLFLERNERAARGPSFLDRIEVRRAADLASALRSFESGDADVGFLGAGLHRRRPRAVDFRTAAAGFVILRSGPEAGTWGAPGVAATLVDAMDPSVLSHLGLVTSHGGAGEAAWGGPPADLLVEGRAPYFVEVARVVAAVLSRPGHELRALPLPPSEFRARRNAGRYSLAVDFVRRVGPTPRHALLSLLAAADPRLADKPPRLSGADSVAITRTLPLAILGELSISGARVPELHGLEAWDLGATFRQTP
jgi:peptide/nickel transport system substrate-binding protein